MAKKETEKKRDTVKKETEDEKKARIHQSLKDSVASVRAHSGELGVLMKEIKAINERIDRIIEAHDSCRKLKGL